MYSKYFRNLLADGFRGGTITFPSTLYYALLTGKPDYATDSYTEIGNVTANNYSRVAKTANSTNLSATNGQGTTTFPSTGTASPAIYNNNTIDFPNPSGGNWFHGSGPASSIVTYIGIFDSATIGGGNLWLYSPITPKKINQTDKDIKIPVYGIYFNFDNNP